METSFDIDDLVEEAAKKYGVDPAILRAMVHQESRGDPGAVSPAGARGLMQLMPGTAKELGVTDPHDPAQSVDAGARYFKKMLEKFGGDPKKALAAYNMGPNALARGDALPSETRAYVSRITKGAGHINSLGAKGWDEKFAAARAAKEGGVPIPAPPMAEGPFPRTSESKVSVKGGLGNALLELPGAVAGMAKHGYDQLLQQITGDPSMTTGEALTKAAYWQMAGPNAEKVRGMIQGGAKESVLLAMADEAQKMAFEMGTDPALLLTPASRLVAAVFTPGQAKMAYDELSKVGIDTSKPNMGLTPEMGRQIVRGLAGAAGTALGVKGAMTKHPGPPKPEPTPEVQGPPPPPLTPRGPIPPPIDPSKIAVPPPSLPPRPPAPTERSIVPPPPSAPPVRRPIPKPIDPSRIPIPPPELPPPAPGPSERSIVPPPPMKGAKPSVPLDKDLVVPPKPAPKKPASPRMKEPVLERPPLPERDPLASPHRQAETMDRIRDLASKRGVTDREGLLSLVQEVTGRKGSRSKAMTDALARQMGMEEIPPPPGKQAVGEGGGAVGLADVQKAFSTQDVQQHDPTSFSVRLPHGRQVVVKVGREGLEFQDVGRGHPEAQGGKVIGQWNHIDVGGVLALAKEAGPSTLRHEVFHSAMSLVLSTKERMALLMRFKKEAMARARKGGETWEELSIQERTNIAEEAAADHYGSPVRQWAADNIPTFSKIHRFFRRMANGMEPTWRDSMAAIRGGEVWEREVGKGVGRSTAGTSAQAVKKTPPFKGAETIEEVDRRMKAGAGLFHTGELEKWQYESEGKPGDLTERMHVTVGRQTPKFRGTVHGFKGEIPPKPLYVSDQGFQWNILKILKERGLLSAEEVRSIRETGRPSTADILRKKGYDPALVYRNVFESTLDPESRAQVWEKAARMAGERLNMEPSWIEPRQISTQEWEAAGLPSDNLAMYMLDTSPIRDQAKGWGKIKSRSFGRAAEKKLETPEKWKQLYGGLGPILSGEGRERLRKYFQVGAAGQLSTVFSNLSNTAMRYGASTAVDLISAPFSKNARSALKGKVEAAVDVPGNIRDSVLLAFKGTPVGHLKGGAAERARFAQELSAQWLPSKLHQAMWHLFSSDIQMPGGGTRKPDVIEKAQRFGMAPSIVQERAARLAILRAELQPIMDKLGAKDLQQLWAKAEQAGGSTLEEAKMAFNQATTFALDMTSALPGTGGKYGSQRIIDAIQAVPESFLATDVGLFPRMMFANMVPQMLESNVVTMFASKRVRSSLRNYSKAKAAIPGLEQAVDNAVTPDELKTAKIALSEGKAKVHQLESEGLKSGRQIAHLAATGPMIASLFAVKAYMEKDDDKEWYHVQGKKGGPSKDLRAVIGSMAPMALLGHWLGKAGKGSPKYKDEKGYVGFRRGVEALTSTRAGSTKVGDVLETLRSDHTAEDKITDMVRKVGWDLGRLAGTLNVPWLFDVGKGIEKTIDPKARVERTYEAGRGGMVGEGLETLKQGMLSRVPAQPIRELPPSYDPTTGKVRVEEAPFGSMIGGKERTIGKLEGFINANSGRVNASQLLLKPTHYTKYDKALFKHFREALDESSVADVLNRGVTKKDERGRKLQIVDLVHEMGKVKQLAHIRATKEFNELGITDQLPPARLRQGAEMKWREEAKRESPYLYNRRKTPSRNKLTPYDKFRLKEEGERWQEKE